MNEDVVTIPSAGLRLHGALDTPAALQSSERRAAFLVLHGFGSNSESPSVTQPTRVLSELGYVTLRFDMRGCGKSEGEFGRIICLDQVEDLGNALSFLARASCRRPRPDRRDRFKLRRRRRGLCRRHQCAHRRGDLQRRLGPRRAQISRPAPYS